MPSIQVDARYAELFSFKLDEINKLFDDKPENECRIGSNELFEYDLIAGYKSSADAPGQEFGVFRGRPTQTNGASASVAFDPNLLPSYILKDENLRRVFAKPTSNPNLTRHKCLVTVRGVSLPVGYLNFVGHILDMQTYTYATLPRIDLLVTDTQSDSGRNEGMTADVPGASASVTINNYYRRIIRAVDPKTSIIGFSESLAPGELKFGWVLSPSTDSGRLGDISSYRPMQSTQRSLSALVTVPTWWNRARVDVTTGWVDDQGKFSAGDSDRYPIPLPIDYESLDATLTEPGRRDSRRPSIALERITDTIAVQPCEKAEILVPGHRLWRSSVVVLGGQRADEVTVLPDMRGIIATFNEVAPRDASEDPDGAVRMLQIWTSEGVAGPIPIKIKDVKRDCKRPPAPEQRKAAAPAANNQPNE